MRNEPDAPDAGVKDLFLRMGVFGWSDCLRRSGGRFSPARVVYAIGFCLRAAADEYDRNDPPATGVEGLVDSLLDRYQAHIAQTPLPEDVETWGPQQVDWWRPREHLGDLIAVECGPKMLVNAGKRMRERGIRVDYSELSDLAAVFSNDYLHRAMRTFDPVRGEGREDAWITTVFFRFATPRVVAMGRTQVAFDEAFHDEEPSASEMDSEQLGRKALLEELMDHLDALPAAQRDALHLYFGLQHREHTLHECALRLGKSVHFARTAITTGLGALAFRLTPEKWDDPVDASVARLLFAECQTKSRIAQQLQMPRKEVNARAAKLGAFVRQSLRARTATRQNFRPTYVELPMSERESSRFDYPTPYATEQPTVLPTSPGASWSENAEIPRVVAYSSPQPAQDLPSVIALIRRAHGSGGRRPAATQRLDPSLQALRAHVKADPALCEALATQLIESGEERLLGYFFAPDLGDLELPSNRSDISGRQRSWNAVVEESLQALDDLAEQFLANFAEPFRSRAEPSVLLRVLTLALPAVSITLEEELEWSARASRRATLRVWMGPSAGNADSFQYLYAWDHAATPSEDPPSLFMVVYQALELAGELESSLLAALANHICRQVAEGVLPLPTFTFDSSDTEGHTLLQWRAPQLQLAEL